MSEPIKVSESAFAPIARSRVTKSIVFLGGLLVVPAKKLHVGDVLPAVALMMLVVPLASGLAGCAMTQESVQLSAQRAFILAQLSFKTMQQGTLTAIKSGVLTGDAKNKAIALIERGQAYENAAYSRVGAGQTASAEIAALAGVISDLTDMGIKPGEK